VYRMRLLAGRENPTQIRVLSERLLEMKNSAVYVICVLLALVVASYGIRLYQMDRELNRLELDFQTRVASNEYLVQCELKRLNEGYNVLAWNLGGCEDEK
jgi:hypothetical protein